VLAPFNLRTHYKRGKDGRPAVKQLVAIRRRPLTSDDSRTGVQRTETVQSTTQRLQQLLSFRTSPQEGLHSPQSDHYTNVVVQLLRCRLSRPPQVSTDVTQHRWDDNLQVI